MFKVDYDTANLETTYSKPDSHLERIEVATNERDNQIIRQKIIKTLATYIRKHKDRAIELLEKHGIQTSDSDEAVVDNMVEMIDRADKSFRDDLATEIVKMGLDDKVESNPSESSYAVLVSAIIAGVGSLIGSSAKLARSSKEAKAQKEQAKAQILLAIQNQKRAELEAVSRAKRTRLMLIIAAIIVLVIVIAAFYYSKKNKNKQE